MKHNLGIDLTYIMDDRPSGIKKHGEEIVSGIVKFNSDYNITVIVDKDLEEAYKKRFPSLKVISQKLWLKNIRFVKRINRLNFVKSIKTSKIKKENLDVIIYPYVNPNTVLPKKTKKIISILDVIPLDEIENKNGSEYNKIKQENIDLMNKTERVVTLSNYSKKRLEEINPEYEGEITVIPSPVNIPKKTKKISQEVINSESSYILSINSFFRHKNQITLLKAFDLIKDKIPNKLVFVGRPELDSPSSGYREIEEYIKKNRLEDRVIILSGISDEDRSSLLYNADLFVTTSLREGFGRTPVEAALCKIPVISSKETSLEEATMGEVFYYENGKDHEELSSKMLEVLENKPSKEELERISKKLKESYDEGEIAKRYIEIIKEIMEEGKKCKELNNQ